jgi:hypothetical protein
MPDHYYRGVRPVAIVICRALPDGDEDAAAAALQTRAIAPSWPVWNDPDVEWGQLAATIVRSTWDYTADREAFPSWAAIVPACRTRRRRSRGTATRPNLRDLAAAGIAAAGIAAVDTGWVRPGAPFTPVASTAELALAQQAVDHAVTRFGPLLYARVDLLPTPSGPVVVELELVEPSLLLQRDGASATRLADAIAALIDRDFAPRVAGAQ